MTTQDPELSAALGWPGGISDPVLDRKVLLQMVAALRLTSKQALEALDGLYLPGELERVNAAITAMRAALAQQAEPVEPPKPAPLKRGTTGRCTRKVCECEKEGLGPECIHLEPVIDGYPLWSGIPKAEPVYWEVRCTAHPKWMRVDEQQFDEYVSYGWEGQRLYTAPPRRKLVSLTDEEILAAVGWERAAMYMKLTPNFPVDEAKQETLKNARTVERAVWEKNHG